MTQVNLGRISIVPQGAWAAGTYKRLDLVTFNGAAYLCIATTTTTSTPTDTAAWMKIVQNGETGATINLSSTNPLANGTVSAGIGTTASRSDHIHPTDTTRAGLGANTFTADQTINGVKVGRGSGNVSSNVVVGNSALNSLTSGGRNIAIGLNALSNAKEIYASVFIGSEAGTWIGNPTYNSATAGAFVVGGKYMIDTIGTTNFTSIGAASNTIGIVFTATGVGTGTGTALPISEQLTVIGDAAFLGSYRTVGYRNSTAIGYLSNFDSDNQVQLGNTATTTYVYGTVQNRSDLRDKADVRDTVLGLDFIKSLRPVDYRWDMREDYTPEMPALIEIPDDATDEQRAEIEQQNVQARDAWIEEDRLAKLNRDGSKKRTRFHHGLIAQEVKAIIDNTGIDFGGYQDHSVNGGGDILSIGYDEFIAPLIKAMQELSADFEAYKLAHP